MLIIRVASGCEPETNRLCWTLYEVRTDQDLLNVALAFFIVLSLYVESWLLLKKADQHIAACKQQ